MEEEVQDLQDDLAEAEAEDEEEVANEEGSEDEDIEDAENGACYAFYYRQG